MKKSRDYLQLVCGECGAPLHIERGEWGSFYGCTNYPQCYNRFTTNIYEIILERVYDYVLKHGTAKGLQFTLQRSRLKVVARVLRETDQHVVVSVVNLTQRAHHHPPAPMPRIS